MIEFQYINLWMRSRSNGWGGFLCESFDGFDRWCEYAGCHIPVSANPAAHPPDVFRCLVIHCVPNA